ncbi:MAG TPA: hypothetical protein VMA31_03055 [Bryobacteraceae bacterium]|nr:hypothetical protein [Bryobacteraceae bacterium]
MRDRKYIDIPGTKTHELPPLLVHASEFAPENAGNLAEVILDEADEMLPVSGEEPDVVEQRRLDLALQLIEHYKKLLSHWSWGDSVLEWIRQCEITFESEATLRQLLHPDLWPHASRASFVNLLMEKDVAARGVALERAVGLRLTFRQPPPIDCFSNQFLFYLNSSVAYTAYQKWSHLVPAATCHLPPDRFHFEVLDMAS